MDSLIAGGTKCQKNIARIDFFFLNNESDTILDINIKNSVTH